MIYLDNCSTTQIDSEVLKEMMPFLQDQFGNEASKFHKLGQKANEAVNVARKKVAKVINADTSEIVFTSGATESINLALKGIVNDYSNTHIITSQIEHKAVLECCKYLENFGVEITYLPVNSDGLIAIDDLKSAIKPNTKLVTIIFGNNEIGTVQDVETIGSICKQNSIPFMTDATQVVGKIKIDVDKYNIDMLCFSAHKIHGPKGVGALYKRKNININSLIHGGDHEYNLRAGTLNTAGIIGFGKACQMANDDLQENQKILTEIQIGFEKYILENNFGQIIAKDSCRLPHISNIILNEDAETFILRNKDIACVSTGSACNSRIQEPSHVLKAIGLSDKNCASAIRFSFNKNNKLVKIKKIIYAS